MRAVAMAALGLTTMLLGAQEGHAQMHAYGLAAKVNGMGISNATLERNFEEYLRENDVNIAAVRNPDRVKAMKREVLDLLIDQELVWQAAKKRPLLATQQELAEALDQMRAQFKSEQAFTGRLAIEGYTEDSYREHIQRLIAARKYLEQVAAGIEVSDDEVHAFYTDNPDKFTVPEAVRARHILLKASPRATEEERRAIREKLNGILAQVRAGADFAGLAKQHSEDSSAAEGGDLGFFFRGQMVKPFAEAAFTLQPGEISEIVETRFGLHIIRVEEYQPEQRMPQAAVQQRIHDYLRSLKSGQARDREIARLRSGAQIEILVPL